MNQPAPGAEAQAATIQVFLAEDHAITLWGLQRLIESRPQRMAVVGTAGTREALLGHPALPRADVLLMDLDLAGVDGLELLPDVQRLGPARVLVLTASEDSRRLCRAVELGAKGVLHKSEEPQHILDAIDQVHRGGARLTPQLLDEVLSHLTRAQGQGQGQGGRPGALAAPDPQQARVASLTARERDIVRVVSLSPSEKLLSVARQLGMSENTLRNHLTTVYSKLGVRGRLELHVFASEHGLTGG